MKVTNKTGYNLLNIARSQRATKHLLISTCLFGRLHDSHSRCHPQANHRRLGCWLFRWAQCGDFENYRCYDMVCLTKQKYNRPKRFQERELHGWELRKYAISLWILTLQFAARTLYFQQDSSLLPCSSPVTIYLNHKRANNSIGMGGLLAWSQSFPPLIPCPFFVSSYEIKGMFYIHRLDGRF